MMTLGGAICVVAAAFAIAYCIYNIVRDRRSHDSHDSIRLQDADGRTTIVVGGSTRQVVTTLLSVGWTWDHHHDTGDKNRTLYLRPPS